MPQRRIKIGTWIDANRVRIVKNGRKHEIQIDKAVKPRRQKKNVAMGFMSGGVFHPIRASSDYSRKRAGESAGRLAPKRKTKAKAKSKTKRKSKKR